MSQVLNRVSDAVVRMRKPDAILDEACRIAVNTGGFLLAWLGQPDSSGTALRPVMQAGLADDYLEQLHLLCSKQPVGEDSAATAWRQARLCVYNDIASSAPESSALAHALTLGFRAAISLPVMVGGQTHSVFTLYTDQPNFFDEDACRQLQQMADKLGLALEVAAAEIALSAALQSLQQRESLFQTLASAAPVGIFRTDAHGRCTYVNASWCNITGSTFDTANDYGWKQSIYAEDQALVETTVATALNTQTAFNLEFRFQRPDGSLRWVMAQSNPEVNAAGAVSGFVGTITDISALKAHEASLRQDAAIFDSTREGVMLTDVNLRILKVNPAFSLITGYSASDVVGNTPAILHSGRHDAEFYAAMWASISQCGYWQGEVWNRRKNGEIYPQLLSISAIADQAAQVISYVGVFADISKLKASESKLEFLAHHDALTGLPNRLLLISRLEHALASAQRNAKSLAVLMIDLDRFKEVNDSLGHLAGDELLQQVGKRILSRLRSMDMVCRLGGDEFTVLLEDIAHADDAARIANEIIACVSEPWQLSSGNEVSIGASVGISLYPAHGDSAEHLLQHADTALYQAKSEGRGRFKYFSAQLTYAATARMDLENRLRLALRNGELSVRYQAQVDIATADIVGAEAQVFWQDPSRGLIAAADFMPAAEESDLIIAIGNWLLAQVCVQGQQWRQAGLPALRLAVKLSPQQLLYGNLAANISLLLASHGFPANGLQLQISERALVKREQHAAAILQQLHALGLVIAIDDFGSAGATLASLNLLPLDMIKLDQSFVDELKVSTADSVSMTAAIIAMAHTLRLPVLAAGVETAAQLALLKAQGCDFYQGDLFSLALSAPVFEAMLRAQSVAGCAPNI
jgi:diguanylate cyclase (GGDEF)-like protein/PAS domain S-box-containing protein